MLETFLWSDDFCLSSSQLIFITVFTPTMVSTRSRQTGGRRNTSRRPSPYDQGASQDNPILVEHPVEEPLIVTLLASMPPTALILFDGSGAIRASCEDPTTSKKKKGSSISDETVPSPSSAIPPLPGSSPLSLFDSPVSSTKTMTKVFDNDIPLQSLLHNLKL